MRVAFLTNKTTGVNLPLYEQLVRSRDLELVHTFFYDTLSEGWRSPREMIANLGLKKVVAKATQVAFARIRMAIGSRFVSAKTPFELAIINTLTHSTISDINERKNIDFIRQLDLDVLVVCVCKNILRREILSLPNMRFVNIHPSLLPKYRGPTPTFWMLYNGEHETGVTIHLMTTKIDQGPILAQCSMPLDHHQTESQVERDVFKLAATMIEDALGSADPPRQVSIASADASYFTFPTATQRRQLRQKLGALPVSSQ